MVSAEDAPFCPVRSIYPVRGNVLAPFMSSQGIIYRDISDSVYLKAHARFDFEVGFVVEK